MMKNKTILSCCLAIAGLMLASCEVERNMSLSQMDGESRLVVYCMPSTSDTTIIQVSHSLPMNGSYGVWRDAHVLTEQCHIIYKVNGREQAVHATSVLGARVGSVPLGAYYVVCQQQAGDHIELSVSHEGYPSAWAETTIPEVTPIGEASVREVRRVDEDDNRETYYQLSAAFSDASPRTADYYAVQVEQLLIGKHYQGRELRLDSTIQTTDVSSLDEPLLNPLTDADDEFLYENDFFNDFYHFDDKQLPTDGTPYTLHLDVPRWHVSGQLRIALYHLSPEYYQFVKSVNDANNNGMAEYGLSTISPTFSNVRGGLGFVGGYSVSRTNWVTCFENNGSIVYTY